MAVIIDIGIKQGTETTKSSNTQAQQQMQTIANDEKSNFTSSSGVLLGTMVARQTLNYAKSNVGKYTGNRQFQYKINMGASLISDVISLGGAISTGNPIFIAMTVGNMATKNAIDIANQVEKVRWENADNKRKLLRAGYNSDGELLGWRH